MNGLHGAWVLAAPEADGSELTSWLLVIFLNFATVVFAGRLLMEYTRDDLGKIIGVCAGAAVAIGVISFPQESATFLADVWKTALEVA